MLVVGKPAEPAWLKVMGAEVLFAPIGKPMMRRARRAAREALGEVDGAGSDEEMSVDLLEELGDAFGLALLTEGILDWRGVVMDVEQDGAITSTELACTDENKAALLADPLIFEAFDAAYVVPFMVRERERAEPGNGSAASPRGTGEAATPEPITVASPAPEIADDAASAPTASTKPGRIGKKASGAS